MASIADKHESSPTFNPADRVDLGGALMHLVKYIRTNMECMIAARVIEYNRNTHIAKVQPLVNSAHPNGDALTYLEHQTFNVTVLRVCHGGFLFDMPIDVGATGWVIAADRDTTFAKEKNAAIHGKDNEGVQIPNSFLKHQYTQGFFIPDSWANILLDTDDRFKNKLVIGDIDDSDEFTAYITISRDGKIVIHGAEIELDAPVVMNGSLTVKKNTNIGGNLDVNGDAEISGNTVIDGNVEIKGEITNKGEPIEPGGGGGGGWNPPDKWVITGMVFDTTSSPYKIKLIKYNLKSGATDMSQEIEMFAVSNIDVVTNTYYTNPNFSQTKKSVTVINTPSEGTQITVFTTTPLSGQ